MGDEMSFMRLGCERLQLLSWALSPLPVCTLPLSRITHSRVSHVGGSPMERPTWGGTDVFCQEPCEVGLEMDG